MNSYTIKNLENLSGIKAHTIRIWEQRYDFLKPQRTQTNIRYYTNDELKTILNVVLLNKYGYKISHINRMQPAEMKDSIMSLNNEKAFQEMIVNELLQEMIDLDIEKFETVLNNYISTNEIERTVNLIIFPFLEKIGILWQTGNVNPAQEYLVSNVIRQKLIIGIETVTPSLRLKKTVLLFLPEGEQHELGLLFMYYILKKSGANTIYLGANVPLKDVEYVVKLKKPTIVFTHLTHTARGFNFEKFLQQLSQRLADVNIIVSGFLTQQYKKKVPGCVSLKKSLAEVVDYLSAQ